MKKTICVIFGGKSSEYPISLMSSASVLRNLDRDKFDVITIGITKEGRWYLYNGEIDNIENDTWFSDGLSQVSIDLNPPVSSIIVMEKESFYRIYADVFFPVLHGAYGEDGRIQGLLDMAGVRYVGGGALCSAIGMDKEYSKIVFSHAGISQAAWVTVRSYDDLERKTDEIEKELSYPVFVKPANAGSSFGTGRAADRHQLQSAIKTAFEYDSKVLVEQLLKGQEVECAVLGNCGRAVASAVGEIAADSEFYTFDSKYSPQSETKLYIPARISESATEKVRALAIKAFEALSGRGLSRVDFFVDGEDIKINEINTMPGFTSISMYPKLFEYSGIKYKELLTRLIELALE